LDDAAPTPGGTMLMRCASARTRSASGRFAWALTYLTVAGCTTVGQDPGRDPAPIAPPADPVVQPGPVTGLQQAQAAEMFDSASAAFESGRAARARELADRIVVELPGSTVSGRALWLSARASLALGNGAAADSAAERYLTLPGALELTDPDPAAVRLLQAEAVADRPTAALERLLRMGAVADAEQLRQARTLARSHAEGFSEGELEAVLDEAPGDAAVRGVLAARHA